MIWTFLYWKEDKEPVKILEKSFTEFMLFYFFFLILFPLHVLTLVQDIIVDVVKAIRKEK